MARSTAKFISYDLRPAKQSERMILVDILKIGGDCGLPIGAYRYVGMGANRFYGYLLLHRYIGIKNMVSLEHDGQMYKRAVFNVPYKFIDVLETSASDFLANDTSNAPTISWLDYDGGIGPEIFQDIAALCLKMKVGDFFFTTVYGGPPRILERQNSEGRLAWLKDSLGDIAGTVEIEDVENFTFRKAVHKMLMAAFQNAFSVRRDGIFLPLLQVVYTDSMPMVTVGGAFLTQGQTVDYRKKMNAVLQFLSTEETKLYEIHMPNLTERERILFDHAVTAKLKRSSEWNRLKKLGFKDKEFNSYQELVRYLPRYVEAIV